MKISSDVMRVLETMSFSENHATITNGQLDRKLYVEVNKVLEACGGKWNRKSKSHVFPDSAEDILSAAINAGEVRTAKDDGFFPTPQPLADRLAESLEISNGARVLEPSAGTGNLVVAALARGAESVTCLEWDDKRRAGLVALGARVTVRPEQDFMRYDAGSERFDRVIMNPAFCKIGLGDHMDHVRRAYTFLAPGGYLGAILPASVRFRTDSRHARFREWYSRQRNYIISDLPDGSFSVSGTMVRTVWLVLRRGRHETT